MVGNFSPSGAALVVEGGYQVSGRWGFGSGCLDADWLICGATVMENGQPLLGPNGQPDPLLFYVPASRYEILDTWHTMGMRGTGSNDFALDGVFVPATHSFSFSRFFSGASPRPGRGYQRPFLELAALFLATTALGIARHAIDAFVTLAATKTAMGATSTLANQPVVHDKVGRAQALLGSGRAYLFDTARQVTTAPEDGQPLLNLARLAAVQAAQSARAAVDLVYEAGGGTSIYQSSPLERCFRDINTVTHHFLISPGGFAEAGKELLNPQG
jgi:alkylation response protein AidB-like acyl-CoA dehydrogenase